MDIATEDSGTAAQEPVTSQPDYLSAALAAYDAGLDPIPIRPGTKKPAIKWKERDKRIPRKKVAKYWKQYPDHEVAILLNDKLFVCDADTPEAVDALYQLEEDLDLTPKVIVETARGEHHYFFRASGTSAITYAPDKAKHPDGIDIKTGHTLLIIPPSTGKKYLQGDITALASLTEVKQPQIDAFDQHNGRRGPQELPCSPIAPKPPSDLAAAIRELNSFLPHLDPDLGYTDWVNVLMVIFHHTGGDEEGLQLAIEWSSPGTKFQGEQEITDKWESFDLDHETPVTVGTLYELVKQQVGEDRYLKIYRDLGPQWDLSCGDTVITPCSAPLAKAAANDDVNPLLAFSLQGQSVQLKQEFANHRLILGMIAIRHQWTVLFAPPNAGKTLIIIWLIIQAIKKKVIDPQHLFYINADDGGSGLAVKAAIADKYRFHMLAPGHHGFHASDLIPILKEVSDKGFAAKAIIILDTVKKFTDTMSKPEQTRFGIAIREFSAKGGTVIMLSHTNKNPDKGGNLVPAGTSDIRDDSDCAYIITPLSDQDGIRTVELKNIKSRGDVTNKAAYQYSIADGLTYMRLLKSVVEIDPQDEDQLRSNIALETSGDRILIELVKGFIAQGINAKTALVDKLAQTDGVSKARARKLIEDYTGTDPVRHRWECSVGSHNKYTYSVLDATSPEPAPPPKGKKSKRKRKGAE